MICPICMDLISTTRHVEILFSITAKHKQLAHTNKMVHDEKMNESDM